MSHINFQKYYIIETKNKELPSKDLLQSKARPFDYLYLILGLIIGSIITFSLLYYFKPEFLQQKDSKTPIEAEDAKDDEVDGDSETPVVEEYIEYPAFDVDSIKLTKHEISMSYWSDSEPLGEYSIMLPVGTKITIGGGTTGGGASFIYKDATGAEIRLSINYPHTGSPEEYLNHTAVANSEIPNLYRVNLRNSSEFSNQWMASDYTTDISTIACKLAGFEEEAGDEYTMEPPCGFASINIPYEESMHSLLITAHTNNNDFSIADEIVGSIKILKLNINE